MSPNATDNTLFATLLPHAIGATPVLGRAYIVSDGTDKKIITVLVQRQDKQPLTRTELDAIELFDVSNNESLPAALTLTRHATPDGDPSGTSPVQSVCFEITATTPGTWRLAARLRTKQGSIVLNQYAESSGNEQESNRLDIVAKSEADCIKDSNGLEWQPSKHPAFEMTVVHLPDAHIFGYFRYRLKNGGRIKSITTLPNIDEKVLCDRYIYESQNSKTRLYLRYLRNDVTSHTPPFKGFEKINFENDYEFRQTMLYEQLPNGKLPLAPFTNTPELELYMVVIDANQTRHNVLIKRDDITPWNELPSDINERFTHDQLTTFFEEIKKNLNNR